MNTTRDYNSPIRDEAKHNTRRQILQAVVTLLEGGIAAVTVPAVAEEAGVSVATVYRHFATKQAMIDALPSFLAEQLGLGNRPLPATVDELATMVYELYADMEAKEPLVRGALMSELASDLRQQARPQRRQLIEALLPTTLADEDRQRLANTLLVLSSSATVWAYKDYLGISWAEAAANAAWAIRMLARAIPFVSKEPPHDHPADPA